jgi:hypothetical protein
MDDLYDMVKDNPVLRKQRGVPNRLRIADFGLNCTECTEKQSENEDQESCVSN